MLIFLSFLVFVITICGIQCDEHGADIVARLKALEDKVERQNDVIGLQATQIKDLQETVSSQTQTISDLTEKVAAQDNYKKKMRKEVNDLKAKARGLERTLKHWLEKVQRASVRHHVDNAVQSSVEEDKATGIQRSKGVNNIKKRFVLDTIETIAFQATITGATNLPHSHINDRVIFETVSLNVGSSYHAGNGTFIAPISGIYIFSTSLMMTKSNAVDPAMHVIIEKNGVEVAGAYAFSRGSYEHSSVTAAMKLQAGDAVFVSVERHDDISFYGDNLTSFMGFLLYPF